MAVAVAASAPFAVHFVKVAVPVGDAAAVFAAAGMCLATVASERPAVSGVVTGARADMLARRDRVHEAMRRAVVIAGERR